MSVSPVAVDAAKPSGRIGSLSACQPGPSERVHGQDVTGWLPYKRRPTASWVSRMDTKGARGEGKGEECLRANDARIRLGWEPTGNRLSRKGPRLGPSPVTFGA